MFVKHHTIIMYGGSRGIAPYILNLDAGTGLSDQLCPGDGHLASIGQDGWNPEAV